MTTAYPQGAASSRKLSQVILHRLARLKNQSVASAIGKDESTVSRIASGEAGIKIDDLEPFLRALHMKAVDADQVCVDKKVFESYRILAAKAMTEPESLKWEDE